jgi:hypothetical protein
MILINLKVERLNKKINILAFHQSKYKQYGPRGFSSEKELTVPHEGTVSSEI